MNDKIKVPKDLGIKIGSKEEVFWTTAKNRLEESIVQYTESLIGEKIMLELANKRIAEEKEKLSRKLLLCFQS